MARENIQKHESYGMIGIHHTNYGGSTPLFGSSIKHDRTINITIREGDVKRDLHREWYYGDKIIAHVEMSAAQFAEFITTPNTGTGIPCTIKHACGKTMERPPYIGQNEVFNKELNEDIQKAMDDSESLLISAVEMLKQKGPMKVSDKGILLSKIERLVQHIKSNMPFLHKQFAKAMDKTVAVAKAEIEAFYTHSMMKLGADSIKKKKLKAPRKPRIERIKKNEE